jgi:hypothetical protein
LTPWRASVWASCRWANSTPSYSLTSFGLPQSLQNGIESQSKYVNSANNVCGEPRDGKLVCALRFSLRYPLQILEVRGYDAVALRSMNECDASSDMKSESWITSRLNII